MVRDLHLDLQIEGVPTVREADGLALSSRNRFLTPEERAQAPVLRGALLEARTAFRRGETRAAALRAILLEVLSSAPLARVDYAEIREADTLAEVATVRRNCIMALAVFFGRTRLIDNLWLR